MLSLLADLLFAVRDCVALRVVGASLHASLLLISVVASAGAGRAADGAIALNQPVESWIASGFSQAQPPHVNTLAELPDGAIGWLDFNVSMTKTGWWRLRITPTPDALPRASIEVAVDPAARPDPRRPDRGSVRLDDWIWLEAGPHRLRLIQNGWMGFSKIEALSLVPASQDDTPFRIDPAHQTSVFSLDSCGSLSLLAGGSQKASKLIAAFELNGLPLARRERQVSRSEEPQQLSVDLPCDKPGDIVATIETASDADGPSDQQGRSVAWSYSVFDPSPAEPAFRRGALIDEIDLTKRQPDFDFAGTRVRMSPVGAYRETGFDGIRRFSRARDPNSKGWFAYVQNSLLPGRPYLMEVEYPDDASRLFIAAFQDSGLMPAKRFWTTWTRYPLSIGVETGGRWPNSNSMKTMEAIIWPRTPESRVIFFNFFDNVRAGISKVRFYSVQEIEAPRLRHNSGRDVIYWFEEGGNFHNLVGLGGEPSATHAAVDRFLRLARTSGATVFMPTTVIYGHQLYPSRYHLTFNDQGRDLTAAFLLAAQRYGLDVIPELHPRADELIWTAD